MQSKCCLSAVCYRYLMDSFYTSEGWFGVLSPSFQTNLTTFLMYMCMKICSPTAPVLTTNLLPIYNLQKKEERQGRSENAPRATRVGLSIKSTCKNKLRQSTSLPQTVTTKSFQKAMPNNTKTDCYYLLARLCLREHNPR